MSIQLICKKNPVSILNMVFMIKKSKFSYNEEEHILENEEIEFFPFNSEESLEFMGEGMLFNKNLKDFFEKKNFRYKGVVSNLRNCEAKTDSELNSSYFSRILLQSVDPFLIKLNAYISVLREKANEFINIRISGHLTVNVLKV